MLKINNIIYQNKKCNLYYLEKIFKYIKIFIISLANSISTDMKNFKKV